MVKDLIIYTPMYVTLFWAVVLLSSKSSINRAKHFLGVFMILAFFVYLSHAVYFKKHNEVFSYFDPVYILASLSVFPLYYWYIKLLTVDTEVYLKNLRLLLPALVLSFAVLVIYWLMSRQERMIYVDKFLLNEDINADETFLVKVQEGIFILSRLVFTFQVVFFLIYGSRLVVRYNQRIANFYSNLESKTIVWVNLLLLSFVITSLMSIVFNLVGRSVFFDSPYLLTIPSVVFSGLLFLIGMQGYMQNHTVVDLVIDEKQYSGDNLRKGNREKLKEKLLELFDKEEVYKNPELKITQVCRRLATNRTYVSNLINNEFKCTFSDYVNGYRIGEAKKLLKDNKLRTYSLNYISERVGFGSLNSFIRIFKRHEGVTPGRFRDLKKFT